MTAWKTLKKWCRRHWIAPNPHTSGLTKAFSVLQNEQEHIKTDVGEIKDDVKQLVSKPAKRWDGLIDKAIAVVVGAAIGFLLNGGGL